MNRETAERLISSCNSNNKLCPPFDRMVHRIGDYVVTLVNHEKRYDNSKTDIQTVRLRNKQIIKSIELIKKYTNIPVPSIVYHSNSNDIIIYEYIEGESLFEISSRMNNKEKERVINKTKEYIAQLSKIPYKEGFDIRHPSVERNIKTDEKLFFQHGDLHPSNIIISRETQDNNHGAFKLSIIDWEFAGYYTLKEIREIHISHNQEEYWKKIY